MIRIEINLKGCDGTTSWTQEVTEEQFLFLKVLEAKSQEISQSDCMPIIKLEEPYKE